MKNRPFLKKSGLFGYSIELSFKKFIIYLENIFHLENPFLLNKKSSLLFDDILKLAYFSSEKMNFSSFSKSQDYTL